MGRDPDAPLPQCCLPNLFNRTRSPTWPIDSDIPAMTLRSSVCDASPDGLKGSSRPPGPSPLSFTRARGNTTSILSPRPIPDMFSRSALAAVVLAAVCGSVTAVSNCARNYTVVAGDTCDGISAKENVSTYQLATVNNATIDATCQNLFVGESLCLGIVGQDCEVTHVVVSGDNCEAIAQAAGTTDDILLANNPNVNSDCSNIYPGEVLCTADDIIVVNSTSTA